MATASLFTKVSLIQQLTLDEAKALMRFMEIVSMKDLDTAEKILVTNVYSTMKKAMING